MIIKTPETCHLTDLRSKKKERETGFEFGNAKKHRKDAGVNLPPSVITHLVTHFWIPEVRGIPDTS